MRQSGPGGSNRGKIGGVGGGARREQLREVAAVLVEPV